MSAFLLLVAVVLFCVRTFGGRIGGIDLLSLGLAFFAASFLVGAVLPLFKRAP